MRLSSNELLIAMEQMLFEEEFLINRNKQCTAQTQTDFEPFSKDTS